MSNVKIESVEMLWKGWAELKQTTLDYHRSDGRWDRQVRITFDHGDGATIIPFDPVRQTVLLVRQFRYAAYMVGIREPLIEACAGLLEANDPETAIRKEAEEELGYRLRDVHKLYAAFMTPGSVTERVWFFTAEYSSEDRVSAGGGHEDEGEDIEVLEMTLDEALACVADERIIDAKTIMLLQHLKLQQLTTASKG